VAAALELREFGLCPIPVGGDNDKTPLVAKFTSWSHRLSAQTLTAWAAKYPDANIGIACGLSGVTIIDIDDPEIIDDMIKRFGETPLITSTPSGGAHLWYRSSGERNANLRFHGLEADVRGVGGIAVVPPSTRRSGEHAGESYAFHKGGWEDVARLPRLRTGSLSFNAGTISTPSNGRNDTLLKYLLRQVRHCDDFDALLDIAHTRNAEFPTPMPNWEVEKTARSAFSYQHDPEKENWVGGPPRVVVTAGESGEISILQNNADACLLYLTLKANHSVRKEPFAVAPEAMAEASVIPAFQKSHNRYRKARDFLDENGLLRKVHHGKGRKMLNGKLVPDPHLFTFSSTPPPESGGNITKTPPPLGNGDLKSSDGQGKRMTEYSDYERISMAAHWADEAADWLAHQLNCGAIKGVTPEAQTKLDTLHDGLRTFAETLGAMTIPYPPPSVPPRRNLRLIK
jgi:hypothetical protein